MDGKNRGAWWKLASGGADLRRPEVIEHEAEMSRRARAAQKHPRYWAHALGIALLMTQFKPVMSALGGDGNFAWAAGMVLTIAVGAFVAGVWHLFGRSTVAQTGRHFVIAPGLLRRSWYSAPISRFSPRM